MQPQREGQRVQRPVLSRLVVNLVSREASFDAPLLKQRGEAMVSAGLPHASNLDVSSAELAIMPSESFLDEIYSDDLLGSGLECLGEDLEAPPARGKEKRSGKVLETAWTAFESAESLGYTYAKSMLQARSLSEASACFERHMTFLPR